VIARTWHGVTPTSKADAYAKFLKNTALKDYRAIQGNYGAYVLRRIEGDRAHFLLISLWESMEAIREFAGPEPEKAVYYDIDKEYLEEFEPHVTHYEVLTQP
jgi:heme-degrading monooxygenase HmoA